MLKSRQKKYFLLTKKKLFSTILILGVFAILFYFGKSKIEKIDCQINKTPCGEELEKEFEEFLGQNFFLSHPRVSHPHWEKVKIKKIPFHKILVEITTRQPVACLRIQAKTFLLDREVVIVGEVAVNPGLPEIEIEKFNQEEVKKALEVIALARQYSLVFGRVKIISEKELLLLLPETEVFLPTEELPSKIASLQMIISRAKIEGNLPKKIDLRFKKPVITF